MNVVETRLPGLTVVESLPRRDFRGTFTRLFCAQELQPLLGGRQIVQINHSMTSKVGTVRGLHFQRPPHAEMKMVRCVGGRIWDVAVDLRSGSPTFLEWHAEELSHDDARMMVVPEGFAHGFQALEPESEVLYLTTAAYCPGSEGGLRPDDTRLAIAWPLAIHAVSPRDLAHPLISQEFSGVAL
ncbi:dTDP-4-dehydrorhamnose 3,5-epimerase [Mycobacterium sp. E802]|uniref:dTDP-4-dehydrorhamnose 3,5-epimerase family protein n=1 Tax=Mycobacterium sp. E802 TaxID=1834152 RepID=UPI0008007EF7|nr:dTDP-4-dehydrorhamnose 3,5-epimerase family protein [Mycobacterium sp. E802]OBG84433.1 dTDP-4-dehydrorhamnose 3,5-epimerase [Mycobacterium sp. E802]